MSKLFNNLTTEGLEEAEDRLGGFSVLNSDIYTGEIKAMYAGASDGGAQNITVIVDIDGREYRETVYVTNKKGENFWVNTKADNKRMPLPGFTLINDICLVATGAPLSDQNAEDKVFKIYDTDAKRELPKTVPMLIDCVGKTVTLAILKVLENKNAKDSSGSYVATADTRESNTIDKVFDTESKMTVVEAQSGAESAVFHDAWLEKNKDQTRDKREIKDGGNGGTAGRPGAANSNSAAAAGGGERKSLFGKKAA